jgi:hypothetical protein
MSRIWALFPCSIFALAYARVWGPAPDTSHQYNFSTRSCEPRLSHCEKCVLLLQSLLLSVPLRAPRARVVGIVAARKQEHSKISLIVYRIDIYIDFMLGLGGSLEAE